MMTTGNALVGVPCFVFWEKNYEPYQAYKI
jgi:hypothetical protein